jgi:hypothetical protein
VQHFGRQEFQGNEAVKPRVLSLIDNAHAAATKLFDNPVELSNPPSDRSQVPIKAVDVHHMDFEFPSTRTNRALAAAIVPILGVSHI